MSNGTGATIHLRDRSEPIVPEKGVGLVGSRYRLLNQLAHGAMGSIYRALDRLDGRVVTLKCIRQAGAGEAATDSGGRLEMAREFDLLASLRHPNIIAVLDYGFDEERGPFFTMDLKENARTILQAGRDKPLRLQVDLLVQTLRAVAYVHRRGIVHCDIKPANVLVVEGQVKLLDFGLSTRVVKSSAEDQKVAGTFAYLAPEILRGEAASPSTDLFAFGVLMHEILTGRHPYGPDDPVGYLARLSAGRPAFPVEGIDPRLEKIVERLLAPSPADRFRDAAEVISAMGTALQIPLTVETIASRESFLQAAEFIGREEELDALTTALAAVREGNGSAWLIGGESGVGKSRLLDELRTRALVRGMSVCLGQATSNGSEPYEMWRGVVRQLLLSAAEPEVRLLSNLKPMLPDIAEFLDRAIPDPEEVAAEAAHTRMLLAFEELLALQSKPVAILLEDLQWAGSESRKLLGTAIRATARTPVLIACSFRDDERPDLYRSVAGVRTLTLKRLDSDEIRRLAVSMIGDTGCEPRLVEFLRTETEGIPYFLVELVRSIAEEVGGLDRIRLPSLPRSATPGGVRRLLRRRLESVPAEGRAALKMAAVISREIDVELMERLVAKLDVAGWCAQCTASAVFVAHEGRFRFAHDKLREQLLFDLDASERSNLHRAVAIAMEERPASAHNWAALAHHWHQAGDTAREADCCQRAGEQALRNAACAEALAYFDRAREILEPQLPARRAKRSRPLRERLLNPNTSVDPDGLEFRVARIEAGLTESHFRLGDLAACRRHAVRTMSLCGVEMPTSTAGFHADVARHALTSFLQLALRFHSNDAGSEAVAREMVRVQAYLWEACFFALELPAIVWCITAMALHCRPYGDTPAMARSQTGLALVGGVARLRPLASRWCASAVRLGSRVCSKSEYAYILNRVNNYRFACCEWSTADREIALAEQLAAEVGDRRAWEEAKSMQGMSGLFQGRFRDGVRAWTEAFESCGRTGNWQIECWGMMGRADNLVRLGSDRDALDLYARAIETFAGRAQATERIWAHGMMSLGALHVGDDISALEHARESAALLAAGRPVAYWTQFGTAATVETLIALAGKQPAGSERRRQLQREADRALDAMKSFARVFPMGRPWSLLLRGRFQMLLGRRRRAMRLWERCIDAANAFGTPYEAARAHLEIAQSSLPASSSRAEHLQKALESFRRCEAARELAIAEQLRSQDVERQGHSRTERVPGQPAG